MESTYKVFLSACNYKDICTPGRVHYFARVVFVICQRPFLIFTKGYASVISSSCRQISKTGQISTVQDKNRKETCQLDVVMCC